MGDYLEYWLYLPTAVDFDKDAFILFRAKYETINKLKLVFEATGSGLRSQQEISISNINKDPIRLKLNNIPYQDITSTSKNIHFSVEYYYFYNIDLTMSDSRIIKINDSPKHSLSHSWILNKEYVCKWGKYWNCKSIKRAKEDIKIYWKHGFLSKRIGYYSSFLHISKKNILIVLPIILFKEFMAKNWMVSIQFWIAIWSGFYCFSEQGNIKRK